MNTGAAFRAMLAGGSTTIIMIIFHLGLPFGIDRTVAGIFVSAVVFFLIPFVSRKKAGAA